MDKLTSQQLDRLYGRIARKHRRAWQPSERARLMRLSRMLWDAIADRAFAQITPAQ